MAVLSRQGLKFRKLTDGVLRQTSNKIIDIGDWDMTAATGTSFTTKAHGLTTANIRAINVLIRSDTGTIVDFPITNNVAATGLNGTFISGTDINLYRETGGYFDNNSYDQTSYNRGWVTIQYVD